MAKKTNDMFRIGLRADNGWKGKLEFVDVPRCDVKVGQLVNYHGEARRIGWVGEITEKALVTIG
jgi:UDP-N-acetylglucosamine pyrophosphorylase